MRARVDGIYSLDLPQGKPALPDDLNCCWVVVQADIGPAEASGSETFTFYVCTPRRLQQVLEKVGSQLGRHLIVVERFDWDVLKGAIRDVIANLEAESWDELAQLVGRHGLWEFEDYSEPSV